MSWISLCFFQQLIGAMFSGEPVRATRRCGGVMAIVLGADLHRMRPGRQPAETIVVIE